LEFPWLWFRSSLAQREKMRRGFYPQMTQMGADLNLEAKFFDHATPQRRNENLKSLQDRV